MQVAKSAPFLILTAATWNLMGDGIDNGSDVRLRRQLTLLADLDLDVAALQAGLAADLTRMLVRRNPWAWSCRRSSRYRETTVNPTQARGRGWNCVWRLTVSVIFAG